MTAFGITSHRFPSLLIHPFDLALFFETYSLGRLLYKVIHMSAPSFPYIVTVPSEMAGSNTILHLQLT